MSQMKVRRVTTSFILNPQQEVLVLKRSEKVHTFQNHWAGVSGSIEQDETPFVCARREILEETALTSGKQDFDLTFVRSGRPLNVESNYGTIFEVHPFLWKLTSSPEKITIDWEHTEYKFIPPQKILELQTVPNLWEAFGRIFVDSSNEKELNSIRDNKGEGATGLASAALKFLSRFVNNLKNENPSLEEFKEKLKDIAWHLLNIRTSMASIGNAVISVVAKSLTEREWKSIEDLTMILQRNIEETLQQQQISSSVIAHCFAEHLQDGWKVLTHSFSGTVLRSLYETEKNLEIISTESRPLMEGRRTVELLREKSKPHSVKSLSICTDACIASIVPKVNCCVVGADSILEDGSFVNKTGTKLISLACQASNIPLYVLCDCLKIRDKVQFDLEEGPSMELKDHLQSPNQLNGVTIINPVFEIIPTAPCIQFITERGFTSIQNIASESQRMAVYREIILH